MAMLNNQRVTNMEEGQETATISQRSLVLYQ